MHFPFICITFAVQLGNKVLTIKKLKTMTTYLLKNENDFLDLKENCFEYKHLTPAYHNTLDAPLEYPCVVVICSFGRDDFFDVEFVYPSIFNE